MSEEKSEEQSIGSYVATKCTKCSMELGHSIILMTGSVIERVKCLTCGSEHKYRAKAKKKTATKKATTSTRKTKVVKNPEQEWDAALQKAKGEEIPYNMEKAYSTGNIIYHSKFGKGVVISTTSKKATLIFQDKERILVSTNK